MNITEARALTFLDVETTGLDPMKHEIISIAIITEWLDSGDTSETYLLIKPQYNALDESATSINGYDPDKWAREAITMQEALPIIADKIKYGPIIAHNAQFDIDFIKNAFLREGWGRHDRADVSRYKFSVGYPVIDTCALSYLILPTSRQNMTELRDYLGLPQEGAHNALVDASHCRDLFWHIMDKIVNTAYINSSDDDSEESNV